MWATGSGEYAVKKSLGQASLEQRHQVIAEACEGGLPISVRRLCDLLQVNRAWYYAKQLQEPDLDQASQQVALRDAIEQLILEFPGYGYRRVTRALQRAGWRVNHKRVLRIMRQESLLCQLKRHFVRTTDSQHGLAVYPNLIAELVPSTPDQIWHADLTYIRLRGEFVYLACLLDGYSRRCVGWQLSRRMDGQLVLDALDMALTCRHISPGLIHHSDRGVQYASLAYVQRLQSVGIQISMSAKGNVYDNAKAESFFKTLKQEEVYLKQYQTFEEAAANIGHFLEEVYNTKRLHSSLGYLPPVEFEAACGHTVRG